MLDKVKRNVIPPLVEYKLLKALLALVGALLVAAGFQGFTLVFIPSGGLVAGGILIEVALVYVVSIGIEKAREDIIRQRDEINEMVSEVREISRDIDQAKKVIDPGF